MKRNEMMQRVRFLGGLLVAGAVALGACGPVGADQTGNNHNINNNNNSGLDASVMSDASGVGQDAANIPDGGVWQLDAAPPTDACPQGMQNSCQNPIGSGCGPTEIPNNGLDDNCDGRVDEGSVCAPGEVQSCFLGPPARANVGACVMGQMVCEGSQEFGQWGPCTGGIFPTAERCDDLDNDCNGCSDDGLCCSPLISCPGPQDIADAQPFIPYPLDGTQWYTGVANSWSWDIQGGPCDSLIGPQFDVTDSTSASPIIEFRLSGDYTVTMTVDTPDGVYSCNFIVHVAGPGVRVELCWEGTGDRDLDLHLMRDDLNGRWCDTRNDCNWRNCKGSNWDMARWGYTPTPLANCENGPSGSTWATNTATNGMCGNPRLDIDNIDTRNIPENINVDQPNDGDSFRAMVHYYSGTGAPNPVVNIYCDGNRIATYGAQPNPVGGFTDAGGGLNCGGHTWRVADINTTVSGGITTCTVDQVHPAGQTSGFDVRLDDRGY